MADELLLLVGAGAGADPRGSLTGGSLTGALLAGLGCGVGMAAGFVFGVDLAGLDCGVGVAAGLACDTLALLACKPP